MYISRPLIPGNRFIRFNSHIHIPKRIALIEINFIPIVAIVFLLTAQSIENRITASTIFKVKIGKRSVAVETAKSYEPYSVVERTLVYKGTSKNTSIFDEKFAIIKTPIFLNKYLNLFSIEVPLSIYAPLKIIKAFINRLNIL